MSSRSPWSADPSPHFLATIPSVYASSQARRQSSDSRASSGSLGVGSSRENARRASPTSTSIVASRAVGSSRPSARTTISRSAPSRTAPRVGFATAFLAASTASRRRRSSDSPVHVPVDVSRTTLAPVPPGTGTRPPPLPKKRAEDDIVIPAGVAVGPLNIAASSSTNDRRGLGSLTPTYPATRR